VSPSGTCTVLRAPGRCSTSGSHTTPIPVTTGSGGTAAVDKPEWSMSQDVAERAAVLAERFADAVGHVPDGVWAAPGRVNLIGEHVDYADGLCLPFALPHTTLVAAAHRRDGHVVARSVQRPDQPVDVALADIGPGTPGGWGSYVAGVAAVLAETEDLAGEAFAVDALVDSEVPVGSGLSSSAALSCATVLALDDLAGLGLAGDDAGRARLAQACVRAENEVAQAPTGGLDQAAVLRCTPGHALLLDCRDGSTRQVPLDPAAEGLALLVIDTRAEHTHSGGEYAQRRAACEEAARVLGVATLREVSDQPVEEVLGRVPDAALHPVVRHVVTEIGRVRETVALLDRAASGEARLADIGRLLDASHASLRDDYRVSSRELDVAVEAARSAGALGARMTGGGFGGSAIALVPAGSVDEVAAAVVDAFGREGLRAPGFLRAEPSLSARRVV
jgi:galactokinase